VEPPSAVKELVWSIDEAVASCDSGTTDTISGTVNATVTGASNGFTIITASIGNVKECSPVLVTSGSVVSVIVNPTDKTVYIPRAFSAAAIEAAIIADGGTPENRASPGWRVFVGGMNVEDVAAVSAVFEGIAAGLPGTQTISLDLSLCRGTTLSYALIDPLPNKERIGVLVLPATVTEIMDGDVSRFDTVVPFYGFDSLARINATGLTTVGVMSFYGLTNLTTVHFPAALTIGENAFCESGLTSVNFPKATVIGIAAFRQCEALTSVNLPAAFLIDENAFTACIDLQTANLPSALTIGCRAFDACENLSSLNIQSVREIATNAFVNCSSLASIQLPSLQNIGSESFNSCFSLVTINLCADITTEADSFPGDLKDKYDMPDGTGGAGTYTRDPLGAEWTKK
jgi:hypothetical protein